MIDCDVHEPLDQRAIESRMDPVWAGWHPIVPPLPYKLPGAAGPDTTLEQLIEASDATVLTGTIHPGNALTQHEYHAAFTRAYNDWLAAEWLVKPGVYGSLQVMSQVPDEAAAEIERAGANPNVLQVLLPAKGGEGFGMRRYRPIFQAADRHDLVIAFHTSASTRTAAGLPEFLAEWQAGAAQSFMGQLMSLVFSGLFEEFPKLRVLVLQGGWTWLPYLMWTADSNYRPLRAEVPWLPGLPSGCFDDHLFFGVNPVPRSAPVDHLLQIIDMAGSDEWLVWGSHHPERGFAEPAALNAFPKQLRRKILHDNAKRLYGKRLDA